MYGYVIHKRYMFFDACFTFIIKNMIVIEMNFRILRLVIPFLVVFGVIMGMRACLRSSSAMHIAMGWWWCVPIIIFPQGFQPCLGTFWNLWEFSFRVYHLGKESQVDSWNGYLKDPNRNNFMWKWNWRMVNIVYLNCWFWSRWWWLRLSLHCTSTLPRPLPWLITEVVVYVSPLLLLIEFSSIQHSLLEVSNLSPRLNDQKTMKKMYNH